MPLNSMMLGFYQLLVRSWRVGGAGGEVMGPGLSVRSQSGMVRSSRKPD